MGKKKTGKNKKCSVCQKEYYVSGWRLKRGPSRFCSVDCQNHKQYERAKFKCRRCAKKFEDSPARKGKKVFCTNECKFSWYSERKIDIKRYRADAIKKVRKKGKLPQMGPSLRRYILDVKELKCHQCGYEEYRQCLDIHHIDKNPSNNDLDNIVILCVMCHRKVHRGIIKI